MHLLHGCLIAFLLSSPFSLAGDDPSYDEPNMGLFDGLKWLDGSIGAGQDFIDGKPFFEGNVNVVQSSETFSWYGDVSVRMTMEGIPRFEWKNHDFTVGGLLSLPMRDQSEYTTKAVGVGVEALSFMKGGYNQTGAPFGAQDVDFMGVSSEYYTKASIQGAMLLLHFLILEQFFTDASQFARFSIGGGYGRLGLEIPGVANAHEESLMMGFRVEINLLESINGKLRANYTELASDGSEAHKGSVEFSAQAVGMNVAVGVNETFVGVAEHLPVRVGFDSHTGMNVKNRVSTKTQEIFVTVGVPL